MSGAPFRIRNWMAVKDVRVSMRSLFRTILRYSTRFSCKKRSIDHGVTISDVIYDSCDPLCCDAHLFKVRNGGTWRVLLVHVDSGSHSPREQNIYNSRGRNVF